MNMFNNLRFQLFRHQSIREKKKAQKFYKKIKNYIVKTTRSEAHFIFVEYLAVDWGIKVSGEEVVVEIFEGQRVARELGNVVSFLEDLLQDGLRLGGGGGILRLTLNLNHEPPQLLRSHVGPTFSVLRESLLHVLRRLRLRHPELSREAHAYPVTPHD